MSRLLVLGCSGKKFFRPTTPIPAWYRYDGMLFRVCKRLEAANRFPDDVQVLILSAEFGLLCRDTLIPWYQRQLDAARAQELMPGVTENLHAAVRRCAATEIYLALGTVYRRAIGPLPADITLIDVREPIGRRMERLRTWLMTPEAQLDIRFQQEAAWAPVDR